MAVTIPDFHNPTGLTMGAADVTVGSMSKAARGGLGAGWVRAAPRLVRELAAVRADVEISSPVAASPPAPGGPPGAQAATG